MFSVFSNSFGKVVVKLEESASTIAEEMRELFYTLSPEQEEVVMKYCNTIFSSGADTEKFFYRPGIKDGLNMKSTVKSILEMLSGNIHGGELKDEE